MAEKLALLIADPALRDRLAKKGQLWAERFDFPTASANILHDFAQLTGSGSESAHNSTMPIEEPFLGEACTSPYSTGKIAQRLFWSAVQATLFRWSPRSWPGSRARLLQLFGADVPRPHEVVIFPTATVVFPKNLTLDPVP